MSKVIYWTSDIHLPYALPKQYTSFCNEANQSDGLIISGDISEGKINLIHYLETLSTDIQVPIYFTLGNHDYYGADSIVSYKKSLIHQFNYSKKQKKEYENLHWLHTEKELIEIESNIGLIGHETWYDGQSGIVTGNVTLRDFGTIGDYKEIYLRCTSGIKQQLKECSLYIARQFCRGLKRKLTKAFDKYGTVIFVTHVPPYAKSAWHDGRNSNSEWVPWFSSDYTTGKILYNYMKEHVDKKLLVLCGHTHGNGTYKALPNLQVHTASGVYGYPSIYEKDTVSLCNFA